MPRTATKTVYQFDELTDSAKEKARDWFREGALDYEWWDFVLEDAKRIFGLCGFTIENIYFRGFWNQGDGACFEGSWRSRDVKPGKVKEEAPQDEKLHQIAAGIEDIAARYPGAWFKVVHRGHYSHEYATEFEFEFLDAEGNEHLVAPGLDDTKEELGWLARQAMRWIYKQLNDEHDYRMADEQVDESIRANEYEFTEDGARYRY